MTRSLSTILLLHLSVTAVLAAEATPATKNPKAVEEVRSGKRSEANAAWWGFDEDDATDALQSAIDSGAKRVIVPNMGKEWVVRPIKLAGNQTLVLETGVVVAAKRGEYRGGGDMVFSATHVDNLTIQGAGATIRMNKEDYIVGIVLKDLGWRRWFGQYVKAEWRMALGIRGCQNVVVRGLTLKDSGGDGIYIDGSGDRPCSKNVVLDGVTCENNYRQGLSIISVDGLVVENCAFNGTWGTPPCSGIDIEPDAARQKVKNVVVRNCRFIDNYGDGIEVFLAHLDKTSDDVSIVFDNCYVRSRWGSGIRVTKILDNGPNGLVEFRNCSVEDAQAYGIKVQDKSVDRARVRFVDCRLKDVARDRNYEGPWAPIWLHPSEVDRVKKFGGVEFVNCSVEDRRARPAVVVPASQTRNGLFDVSGEIRVSNPNGVKAELGSALEGVALSVVDAATHSPRSREIKHTKIFHKKGQFGGWPANHGIWSWGNEILVGFSAGSYKNLGPERHAIDREAPEYHLLARSLDGGETWSIENPSDKGALIPIGPGLHGVTPPGLQEKPWQDSPGGIDFTHPDFAMAVRMTDANAGTARFYYSTDRGKNWSGPFRLPLFGQRGIAARTDYIVNGKNDCTLFLTSPKSNGKEGRPLCVRTQDGGKTWRFVSWITDEPNGYSIMPSTVRLGPNELLTAIRRKEAPRSWVENYRSLDDGLTWRLDSTPAPDLGEGNPASMIRLKDGRVCITYGKRSAPFSMAARLSGDGGKSWGPEIVLRNDGAGRDLGYPRTVQRPDGKIVTIYYFWDKDSGPERYIAATLWDPS